MNDHARISDELAGNTDALVRLGRSMMNSGRGGQALVMFKKVSAERPNDPDLANAMRTALSHNVPTWHRNMLHDTPRDEAFDRAIRRAITPDMVVLDIGTGSGLLAMMAARAGATRIVACERHPALAETARDIVAANGYADRITILSKYSRELDRDRDLAGGADLIIAEVFGRDLLAEDMLRTIEDAVARLARPGVQIIPRIGAVRVALAHCEGFQSDPLTTSGFDVGKFAVHYSPSIMLPVGYKRLALRSRSTDLMSFDLRPGAAPTAHRTSVGLSCTGPANGFVQWIKLELDDIESYENAPAPGAKSSWYAAFHPFADDRPALRGECVQVHASHDFDYLRCWEARAPASLQTA